MMGGKDSGNQLSQDHLDIGHLNGMWACVFIISVLLELVEFQLPEKFSIHKDGIRRWILKVSADINLRCR